MKKNLYILFDIIIMSAIFYVALVLRFDGVIPARYLAAIHQVVWIYVIIKVFSFFTAKIYRIIWMYASIVELVSLAIAVVGSNLVLFLLNMILTSSLQLPRSIFMIALLLDMLLLGGYRIIPRLLKAKKTKGNSNIRTVIIGAGQAGTNLVKDIKMNPSLKYEPVCFLDDDPTKKNKIINGLIVEGGIEELPRIIEKYSVRQAILAIPSLGSVEKKEYVQKLSQYKLSTKTLPSLDEMIEKDDYKLEIRDIRIEDLLGRDEIYLDQTSLQNFLSNQIVMITGAGGSIGSELARQVIKYSPKLLVLLDVYENNLYDIQNELVRNYPDQPMEVLIESVRNTRRMKKIFEKYKPEIVFHAAAHKHVPLMEKSIESAILNNVFGTYNLAQCSNDYHVKRFIQISTDKAVNPTNVMGATKRIDEMIIQAFDSISTTEYVSVRFGNVLGSNGSVIPLFLEQIRQGGPVTVTHRNVIRYFMTIPEACRLVLQAGSYAKGGETFILDMGEPVRILDLAENLIRLSGYRPYEDIEIRITGLREGEKLYEELLVDPANMTHTDHDKIFIDTKQNVDKDNLERKLQILEELVYTGTREEIIDLLVDIVPTFHPQKRREDATN